MGVQLLHFWWDVLQELHFSCNVMLHLVYTSLVYSVVQVSQVSAALRVLV